MSAFTVEEIGESVGKSKARKSPGPDGITGGMMKRVWESIPDFVTCLYERCATEGYFPKG